MNARINIIGKLREEILKSIGYDPNNARLLIEDLGNGEYMIYGAGHES